MLKHQFFWQNYIWGITLNFLETSIAGKIQEKEATKILNQLKKQGHPFAYYYSAFNNFQHVYGDKASAKSDLEFCKKDGFIGGIYLLALAKRAGWLSATTDIGIRTKEIEESNRLLEKSFENIKIDSFYLIDIYYGIITELGKDLYSDYKTSNNLQTSYLYLNKASKSGFYDAISFLNHARFSDKEIAIREMFLDNVITKGNVSYLPSSKED